MKHYAVLKIVNILIILEIVAVSKITCDIDWS